MKKNYVLLLFVGVLIGVCLTPLVSSGSNSALPFKHWNRNSAEGFVYPRVGTDDVNLSGNSLLDADLSGYAGTNISWSGGQFHSTGTGGGGGFWSRAGTTLYPSTNNDDVQVNGTVNATDIIATDDMYVADRIYHIGDLDTSIRFVPTGIAWYDNGILAANLAYNKVSINPLGDFEGYDLDFQCHGTVIAALFKVDAGLNRVGIRTNSPDQVFDVNGNTNITGDLNVTGDLTVTGAIVNDAIYAQLSDSTDQTFGATGTGYAITFNTNDEINGITHSTVSETANITIVTSGVYSVIAQPQVHAGAGDAGYFHMWLRRDAGGGFVDVPNSNVELTLDSLDEDVIPLIVTISLDAGDIIRVNASVGDNGIELDAQTPVGEPAIPSIIFSMYRIGS